MSKIGIMSMQRIVNYGSFLQAYGLKSMLEELGNKVEFIDYQYEKSLVESKKDNLISRIRNNINLVNFYKKRNHSKQFKSKYNDYLKSIGIENKNYNKNIDTLVIGSDEVFNCLQPYPVGFSRGLFGYGYEKVNVVSYAASFGFTKLEGLKNHKIENEVSKLLRNFKSISVRDLNSFEIVKKLTNKTPLMHLDPVLVSDYSSVLKKVNLKNYIIIYAYTGRLTKSEERYIKKFAKKYNKKIVSIGFYQKIADLNLIVHPFEVLSYFKNADYVITDTFHGTIFSIKMNTKFCTIIRESNRNKLEYLLEKLDRKDRMINYLDEIDILYNKEVDFSNTNKIITDERSKTLKYLKENL